MRTKEEITLAIQLLELCGGEYKQLQAVVLKGGMTEAEVFDTYVVHCSGDKKNEALYFAVRDAAQYVSGKLTLEELVPDATEETWNKLEAIRAEGEREFAKREKEQADKELTVGEIITQLEKDYNTVSQYADKLEKQVEKLEAQNEVLKARLAAAERSAGNLKYMSQQEAASYLGCSRRTLGNWTRRGLVTGYKKGLYVYYIRKELDRNDTVKAFKAGKEDNA